MRGRCWACVLLLLATAVAGCTAPGPEDNEDPGDSNTSEEAGDVDDTLPWGMTACRYIVSWGWVDGDRVESYLPDGFTLRRSDSVPPPSAQGDTLFGVDVMTCESGQGLSGNISSMQVGFIWVSADPPQGFFLDDVPEGEHYAKWDVLVPDAERREALQARGVPARDGSASLQDGAAGPEASLTLSGLGTIQISTVARGELNPFDGDWVKFTAAEGGAAGWRAHAESGTRSTGDAVITFPEVSWPSDVTDGQPLVGGFHSGVWTVDQARVIFLQSQ